MPDNNTFCWLYLYSSVGSNTAVCDIIRFFGSAKSVLEASRAELIESGLADADFYEKIHNAKDSQVYAAIKDCNNNGWQIITPDSDLYPPLLKTIGDFPLALFADGKTDLLVHEPKIAIVGTRHPINKSLDAAFRLALGASSTGATVVSGGAVGIDSAAHEGAMLASGSTVAVLGTGLGSDYLPERANMRKRISENGVLVTEFFPFMPPAKYTFPRRNRIISGMSNGVAVIESGTRGGSLITADYAIKYRRELYVLAQNIVLSPGCTRLVKLGAKTLNTPGELMRVYRGLIPDNEWNDFCLELSLEDTSHTGSTLCNSISEKNINTPLFTEKNQSNKNTAEKLVLSDKNNTKTAKPPKIRAEAVIIPNENEQKSDNSSNSNLPSLTVINALSADEKLVYEALSSTPSHYDEIKYTTGLQISRIMSAVTLLEIKKLIECYPGDRFTRR